MLITLSLFNLNRRFIKSITVCLLVFIILSCSNKTTNKSNNSHRDLEAIKKEGKLRALTIYSGTSYFLYKGKPMGYEFELLERFAQYLEVELEIIVVKNIDELISKLIDGKADILAYGLAITNQRQKKVAFTDYLYLTHQVLVQKKPDNYLKLHWKNLEESVIHDAIELLGDTVSLRERSSYKNRISNLSEELGGQIYIDTIPGGLSTEEIIKMVVDGKVKYTVADNNIAQIMASYYPILDVEVPISFSQRIGWATHKNSEKLLEITNTWLEEFKKEVDYNVIYNKYFKNKKNFKKRVKSEFYSLNSNEISPYDDLIKIYSKELNWDWRLVTSLIYQESRFDPNKNSWAGAKGLMQLMPATANELEVKDPNNPEESIKGGVTYLKQMWNGFSEVEDTIQRVKFSMAAYNCGLYHVKDAQNLAVKKGLNPNLWDTNVEEMILALSIPQNYQDSVVKYGYVRGEEPYNYVAQIFERFEHYKQFVLK